MSIALPALAVAFTAFCVWLAVRIINRRERWAKRTAAILVGVPVLYVLSVGPATWMYKNDLIPDQAIELVYAPIIWLVVDHEAPLANTWIAPLLGWYVELWAT